MNIDFWAFVLGALAVLVLYALYEGLYRQPRKARKRAAINKALSEIHKDLLKFMHYLAKFHPDMLSLVALRLLHAERNLAQDYEHGQKLVVFRITETRLLYEEYLKWERARADAPQELVFRAAMA